METITEQRTIVTYRSEVMPEIETTHPKLGKVIAWADEHPVVWKIVTTRKSKAFGLGSSVYIGWAQTSKAHDAVLERARDLMELIEHPGKWGNGNSIFTWRARFTLDHFQDKGFKGGFFQQHDAGFPRGCLYLDYTPKTFEQVLDKFCEWMDRYYHTRRVTVDGKTVRTFAEEG